MEKDRKGWVKLSPDDIKLLQGSKDWPISYFSRAFTDRSGIPDMVTTDEEIGEWNRRNLEAIPACAAAINGALRKITVKEYIRQIQEARIIQNSNKPK
jgi:hypothetical protein